MPCAVKKPPGREDSPISMRAIAVGQAILPAAAFQAARRARREFSRAARRRLKAGGSHDWLPHRAARPQPSCVVRVGQTIGFCRLSGYREDSPISMRAIAVGQAILPAAAFPGGAPGSARIPARGQTPAESRRQP